MIYALAVVTFAFVFLNYELGKHDYLYPPFLYSFAYFFFTTICAIGARHYSVVLSAETLIVIMLGITTFTFFFLIFSHFEKRTGKRELEYIDLRNSSCIILIILQLISIFSFVRYLKNIAATYSAAGYTHLAATNLSGMIKLYDTLTKFWKTIFSQLSVPIPMEYRLTNPICSAAEYMLLYIGINNYILTRKINKLHVIVYIVMIVRIFLNGSTIPLLRVATFAMVIYYVLQYRRGHVRKGSYKLLGRIILASFGLFFIMIAALFVMGRASGSVDLGNALFTYAGAPIANLNIFINRYEKYFLSGVPEKLFGAQTFGKLYAYMGKLLSINVRIDSFSQFETSGKFEIGNVYTMFASVLYDFGIIGVIFIEAIMAFYYGLNYYKIMNNSHYEPFDYRLFIYAYLINDIIMSAFSNRFFETVCDAPFIKLLVMSLAIRYLYTKSKIRIKIPKILLKL